MSYQNTFIGRLPLIVQIIIYGILILIGYNIYRWIKRKVQAGNYNAAVNQSQTALNQLAQQGVKPSYAQAQYTSMANAMQQAFDGCGAAYSDVLEPIFKQMKNDADIYALIQNYGVRDIAECGWGTFNGDLAATIGYKFSGVMFCSPTSLSCGSISEINKAIKSGGSTVTFQF